MEKKEIRRAEEDSLMLDGVVDRLLSLLDTVANVDHPSVAVEIALAVRDVVYTKAQIIRGIKGSS